MPWLPGNRRVACEGEADPPLSPAFLLAAHLEAAGHGPDCLALHYTVERTGGRHRLSWWWECTRHGRRLTPPHLRTFPGPEEVREFVHREAGYPPPAA